MRFFIGIIFCAFSLASFGEVYNKKNVHNLIEKAQAIFIGFATSSELVLDNRVATSFKVIKVFKGEPGNVEVVFSQVWSTSCDIPFIVGKSHVVLVDKDNEVVDCNGYDEVYDVKHEELPHVYYRGILKELRLKERK